MPLTIVSIVRYGLHAHLAYFDVLAFLSRHGEDFFANDSVNGILNGYFSPAKTLSWNYVEFTPYHPVVYAGTLFASAGALAGILLPPVLRRKTRPQIADFGAAAICTVIGSPVAWEHHYGILLPIYGVALESTLDLSLSSTRNFRLACLALSWILVADFIPFVVLLDDTPFILLRAHSSSERSYS